MSEQDAAETDDAGAADPRSDAGTPESDSEDGATAADAGDEVAESAADSDAGDGDSDADATVGNGDSTAGSADAAGDEPAAGADRESDAVVALTGGALEVETSEAEPGVPEAEEVEAGEFLGPARDATAEETARAVALLRQRIADLEERLRARDDEVTDLETRLRRKQADFQNYKKRQKERLEDEKRRATEDLVERLLDVRDSLARALDQGEDAEIRSGVETTLTQFDEQLKRENVDRIEPDPGDEVDPERHEALATIASDQPEDTVAEVHRPGYEMAGKIIRPAQVAVSDGSDGE
jgi:molecular chaperone GrpE